MRCMDQEQVQRGHETWHGGLSGFHAKEAAKYHTKADELAARGKVKAAARARKVAERNERLAAQHADQL